MKEENVVDVFYGDYMRNYPTGYKYTADGDAKIDVTYIGIKYNYTRMLTKTLPIFWNAGLNLSIPVKTNLSLSTVTIDNPDNYSYDYYYGESQEELMIKLRRGNIFKVNFGIGYLF